MVRKLTIYCSVLFIILGTITIIVIKNDKKFDKYYLNIYEVDKYINSELYNEAGEHLSSLVNDIYNTKTALIFLKRSEIIAYKTNDYRQLAAYSLKLYNTYSHNTEIAAVCSYALKKNNDFKNAMLVSEEKLKKSEYKNLHLLNIIDNNIQNNDLADSDEIDEDYQFLFTDEYTPDMFETVSSKNWDERYLLDEALLLLKNSKIDDADDVLSRTAEKSFPHIKMLISYDKSEYKKAERYFWQLLSEQAILDDDSFFTGCDILLRNGKDSNASDFYKSYLIDNPDKNSLPYRNLYSINKNNPASLEWLSTGLSFFPESRELILPLAWKYYSSSNYDELKSLMSRLESDDDVLSELLELNIGLDGRNPEHIIGNYWNIFNKDAKSEIVARSFSNYLLKNKRYEQLELLLKKYSDNKPPEEWVYQYLAIGKVMSGEYTKALDLIEKAIDSSENCINIFNKAFILELQGFGGQAEEYYKKSLIKAEQEEINFKNHSKIYFKLAETNYNNSSFKDAYHYIRMAIDLDPDNMKNKLFLRKIKEEYND